MHSTQCPPPDQAGQNVMLNLPELAATLRPKISALNYLGESRQAAPAAGRRGNAGERPTRSA